MTANKQYTSNMTGGGTTWQQSTAGTSLKPCNPSVCVGGAQPTSCYCPTTPHK